MATELKKDLTLFGLTMIAIGATIGSGIFLTPSKIASNLQEPGYIIGVWILGGVIALTGALTFAELGSMYPKAGGIYIYLREAYGDRVAFLYGWVQLLVINTGSIAALCLAFARYVNFLVPLGDHGILILAIVALCVATTINVFGVKTGQSFSNLFTGAKLAGIATIIIGGAIFVLSSNTVTPQTAMPTHTESISTLFALSLIGVLWSYGGWQHASFLAGEAKNAERTIPKAMIMGALFVTIVYVLVNLVYLSVLSPSDMANSKAVAADTMNRIAPWGGTFIAVLIAVSTFGTMGIYTLSVPRIYYAMAKDGIFFQKLAELHPTYGTPVFAIVIQSVWTIVLLLFWGTFENLIDYVTFMDFVFFLLVAIALFKFRKTRPDAVRGYKTLGYPVTPIIFITIVSWFLLNTLIGRPHEAGAGLVVVVLGLIIYYLLNRKVTNPN